MSCFASQSLGSSSNSRKRQSFQISGNPKKKKKKEKGKMLFKKPEYNDEDELASDSDIPRSYKAEDLNGEDGDEDVETVEEKLQRLKEESWMYKHASKFMDTLPINCHAVEDVDGRILKFETVPIFDYQMAKQAQTELMKLSELVLLLKEQALDSEKQKAEKDLHETKKNLAQLEEIERARTDSNEDFMFFATSSNISLKNPTIKEYIERAIMQTECAFLPSPEALKTTSSEGSDKSGTLQDFQGVSKWAYGHSLCQEDIKCYEVNAEGVDEKRYSGLVNLAFNKTYEMMMNTPPRRKELILYYYAGHGLDQNNAKKLLNSATPVFEQNLNLQDYMKDASPYIGKIRKVKGGEMFLHKHGFCDFEGLVELFIAATKCKSILSSGEKENKHLLTVLDSCYSGQFAEDLEQFLKKHGRGWLNKGCSVTVQASCGKDEQAVGGYFTPTFLYLNDPKNKNQFQKLLEDWDKMKEEQKDKYKDLPFPSPILSSTRNLPNNSPVEQIWILLVDQNFHMTLFKDAAFFKYCHCEIFGPLKHEETPNLGISRVFAEESASKFLTETKEFTVLDFKLKTMKHGAFKGQKLGLFLVEMPDNPNLAVCAHVHFLEGGTSKVGRINLLHHRYNPNSLVCFEKPDIDGLSDRQVKKEKYKIAVARVPNCASAKNKDPSHWVAWKWKTNLNQSFRELAKAELVNGFNVTSKCEEEIACAMKLVTECHDFVESKQEGWWTDPKQWQQENNDLSYLNMFRKNQRSVKMGEYLEQMKDYDLPKVQ